MLAQLGDDAGLGGTSAIKAVGNSATAHGLGPGFFAI